VHPPCAQPTRRCPAACGSRRSRRAGSIPDRAIAQPSRCIDHDRDLQSPRPGDFKKRMRKMAKLASAVLEVDLYRENAPVLDRHLLHWLLNADFDGARNLLRISGSITAQAVDSIKSLERFNSTCREIWVGPGRRMRIASSSIWLISSRRPASRRPHTPARTQFPNTARRRSATSSSSFMRCCR
jgi:hypothetical protein